MIADILTLHHFLFCFVSSHHPCCRSYLHHGKEPRGPPGPKVLRSIPTEWRVPTATGRRRSSQAGHPKEWPGLALQNRKTHCQRVGELEFYRLSGMAIPGPPTVFNNCFFFLLRGRKCRRVEDRLMNFWMMLTLRIVVCVWPFPHQPNMTIDNQQFFWQPERHQRKARRRALHCLLAMLHGLIVWWNRFLRWSWPENYM